MRYSGFNTEKHDIDTVAELIFTTDIELSSFIFGGDRDRAVSKIKRLIQIKGSCYAAENIHVADRYRQVLGVIVACSARGTSGSSEQRSLLSVMNAREKAKFIFLVMPLLEILIPEKLKPGELYISNLSVKKEHRSQGVGSFLLTKITEDARREGFSRLWLYASADNAGAIKLYEKTGFEVRLRRSVRLPGFKSAVYRMELVL